ncbi:MAG: AraC family transcriptional regulator [Marmoricola sp.]|nr:AraC family transcriptional regulator [Marmoricola sp.]
MTATDTFIAFVDVLAEVLDPESELARGGASAEELAGRLYLSRFHLDRVISSVAGEPPRRFRRRILLERAAYRLITTGRSILDVAVEAGFGSHEAFTRAFTKAYGEPPAVWRRRPRTIRIEAPSGVHFHPPGSIRLPARNQVTPMDLLTRMVEHHVWLTGEILNKATRLTDEQLDERIEVNVDDDEQQSLRRLLSRLIGQMGMWNAALADQAYDWSVEQHESLTSMRERLANEGPTYLSHVHDVVAEGRLDDTFVDALCEPAEVFTYGGMIAHVLTFAAHNRTLAVLALDKHGISELGWGDPMKWVATPA